MSEHRPTLNRRVERHIRLAPWSAVLVWALWAVSVLFVAISVATARPGGQGPAVAVILGLAAISFATAGAILVSRLPGNVIGWLLALIGLCLALGSGAAGLADAGLNVHPGSVPGAIWFAWLTEWIWAPAVGIIALLLLVYPSGRLLSAQWRPVAVATGFLIVLLSIGSAVGPWPDGQFPVDNPLLITGGSDVLYAVFGVIVGPLALAVAVLSVASLVIRYRRSAGVERQQLKWFVSVAAISVPAFLVSSALFGIAGIAGDVANVLTAVAFVGFALLPVAIGIAVLRYRLFEIDRIISRTIGWAMVTGVLATVFVAVILVTQAALAPITSSNTLAVAASTLVVFALFQPIRRRIQTRVDRRFNRARYDAERTLAVFASGLRDEVDLGQLRVEITHAVRTTVQPASVSLWLRR